jgi:PilZ domain-containing protein
VSADSGRESERLALPRPLHGEVLVFQRMDIRQLSVEGALIETAFPLTVDSVHAFRLTLDEGPVVVKGRVAHSHIAEVGQDTVIYHSGIEFVAVTPPVARTISAFLERFKSARER